MCSLRENIHEIVTVHSVHSNVAKIHSRLLRQWNLACMSRDFGIFMPKHLAE